MNTRAIRSTLIGCLGVALAAFWSAGDLERNLHFRDYYNRDRVHASLGGATPACKAADISRRVISLSEYQWQSPLPRLVSVTRRCLTRNSPQTGAATLNGCFGSRKQKSANGPQAVMAKNGAMQDRLAVESHHR